jgi:hypothetical protein
VIRVTASYDASASIAIGVVVLGAIAALVVAVPAVI